MGFPTHKLTARAAMIGVMLGGGLLFAGISQAQDVGASDIQAERAAELTAASGGPASPAHLIAFKGEQAAVEARADDVADVSPAAVTTPATQPTAEAAPEPDARPRRIAAVTSAPTRK